MIYIHSYFQLCCYFDINTQQKIKALPSHCFPFLFLVGLAMSVPSHSCQIPFKHISNFSLIYISLKGERKMLNLKLFPTGDNLPLTKLRRMGNAAIYTSSRMVHNELEAKLQ